MRAELRPVIYCCLPTHVVVGLGLLILVLVQMKSPPHFVWIISVFFVFAFFLAPIGALAAMILAVDNSFEKAYALKNKILAWLFALTAVALNVLVMRVLWMMADAD